MKKIIFTALMLGTLISCQKETLSPTENKTLSVNNPKLNPLTSATSGLGVIEFLQDSVHRTSSEQYNFFHMKSFNLKRRIRITVETYKKGQFYDIIFPSVINDIVFTDTLNSENMSFDDFNAFAYLQPPSSTTTGWYYWEIFHRVTSVTDLNTNEDLSSQINVHFNENNSTLGRQYGIFSGGGGGNGGGGNDGGPFPPQPGG